MNLQCIIRWSSRIKICNCRTEVKIYLYPAEQMEAIYAAGACWYSERSPNPPLLRPRIACLQAASEVSTAVQEEKHLRTSWSYNWRAAPDNDGGVVRER